MKTVLCIDGGGIRGIIPAMLLEEIEKRTGKPISDSFDLITGVSTGGIISVALTTSNEKNRPKYKASDIVKFYIENAKHIFTPSSKIPFYYLLKSKYRNSTLKSALTKYIGHTDFSKLLNNVMIPCYDINERRPYFFKSWKISARGMSATDISTATCCAPIYFDPYIISTANGEPELALIDGSVCTNNPAMCAYAEAKRLWEDEEIFVVSIGTGDISDPIKYKKKKLWGVLPWFTHVIEILIDAPTNTVDYQLKTLCPENYVRIHNKIQFASEKIDDVKGKNLKNLITEAKGLIASEDFRIERIVEMIERRDRKNKKIVD